MLRSRYKPIKNTESPYFISTSVVNWIPVFGNPTIAEIVFESLKYLHNEKRITLHAYVLMENHLHLIVSSADLSAEIRSFKSFTARCCIDWYQRENKQWILKQLAVHKMKHKSGQAFQFWQEGFHPKLIQSEAMLLNKLVYIHNNPMERGYIDDPAAWKYSSYRNYMGLDAVLPVVKLC